jgi:1-acyl-sn-glycerol-3-phosphate acyltransferase
MKKLEDFFYTLGINAIQALTNYELIVQGEEVPDPAFIASNHYGSFDSIIIGQALKREVRTFSHGKGNWLKPPHFIPHVGRIELNRGINYSANQASSYLKRGYSLIIFPEGKEEKKEESKILPIKRGVFHFSERLNLPVTPIAIKGVENVWPRGIGQRFPSLRGKVSINVGKTEMFENERSSCYRLKEIIEQLYYKIK